MQSNRNVNFEWKINIARKSDLSRMLLMAYFMFIGTMDIELFDNWFFFSLLEICTIRVLHLRSIPRALIKMHKSRPYSLSSPFIRAFFFHARICCCYCFHRYIQHISVPFNSSDWYIFFLDSTFVIIAVVGRFFCSNPGHTSIQPALCDVVLALS